MQNKPTNKDSLSVWLSYIEKIHPNDIDLGLDRVFKVKNAANIFPKFPVILVGGTNGKGSTCSFIESILNESGLNIGCYTSPHFRRFNERIRINKHEVSNDKIVESLHYIENQRQEIPLTYFEITTLAAVNIFINDEVDIAVLEVGLGGRLDAVNAFDPIVSILTSVSLDHQNYLGDTVDLIAFEKSGIFRKNKPAIVNHKNPLPSLISTVKKLKSELSLLNSDYKIIQNGPNLHYTSDISSYSNLPLPNLIGEHQKNNLAGALRCIDFIKDYFPISEKEIITGIKNVKINGRFEIIKLNPFIVADVAHNQEAAISLASTFKLKKLKGNTIAVFSILRDKNIDEVVAPFFEIVDEWHIAEIESERSAPIEQIEKSTQQKKTKSIRKYKSLKKGYQEALNKSKDDDNILIFGSFFVISEIFKT